jgi:hypothetical protein
MRLSDIKMRMTNPSRDFLALLSFWRILEIGKFIKLEPLPDRPTAYSTAAISSVSEKQPFPHYRPE